MLWSIVKDGARRGLAECQKVFSSNRWNCPVEMYKKLPIFDNTTFPYGKFHVQWHPAITKCHSTKKNVRYSEDPAITNYLVNNKNICYSEVNNGIYTTQHSLQTCA